MARYKGITNRSYCTVVHIICTSRESGMNPTGNLGAAFQIVMARTEKQGAASMAGTSPFSRERTRKCKPLLSLVSTKGCPSESTGKGLVLIFALRRKSTVQTTFQAEEVGAAVCSQPFVASVGKARTLYPSPSITYNNCCHDQLDHFFYPFVLFTEAFPHETEQDYS